MNPFFLKLWRQMENGQLHAPVVLVAGKEFTGERLGGNPDRSEIGREKSNLCVRRELNPHYLVVLSAACHYTESQR